TTTSPFSPLSLHDALPISPFLIFHQAPVNRVKLLSDKSALLGVNVQRVLAKPERVATEGLPESGKAGVIAFVVAYFIRFKIGGRSEEHTSELQSRGHLVCR